MMEFIKTTGAPLQRWDFARRERRFFMYGTQPEQVAHCANTGSLRGVLDQCVGLWVSDHGADTSRKLRYTAELAELRDGTLVGINTQRANGVVAEALAAGVVPQVRGAIAHEVKFDAGTRFDLRVGETWVEVKNTTLVEGRVAMFPDAVTERGAKHLRVLREIVAAGGQALQVYCCARGDVTSFAAAAQIDPTYAAELAAAKAAGVLVVALGCRVTPQGLWAERVLPMLG